MKASKKPSTKTGKLTKKELLKEMQLKSQELNLLMSALQGDRSTSQENLESYRKKFVELMGGG